MTDSAIFLILCSGRNRLSVDRKDIETKSGRRVKACEKYRQVPQRIPAYMMSLIVGRGNVPILYDHCI